jgi:hypothetical protein
MFFKVLDLCLCLGKLHTCQANDAGHNQPVTLKDYIMTTEQIITALQDAKLFEAAKLQCGNVDNMSMLVAVATGKVATYSELYELYRELMA